MGNPSKRIPVMTLCLIAATLLLVGTASAAAPQAAFSSSTTSGAEPLTVQFTDTSTGGDPDGWAWFFGDETYGDAWTNQTAASGVAPGWEARGGHTSVAMPDGSIVLMGGHDDGYNRLNDTWLSRDGGTTWTVVNTSPGWSGRDGHAAVAVGDSIVLMGGNDGALKNDVWRSDDYGATWENITPQDPDDIWPARRDHTSVTMPDGSIVTMGGSGAVWRENDVWRSDDYGATWTRQTANAEWTARYAHSSVVVGDSIVLMCGYDGSANQNDVWRSDDYGATWVEVTPDDWWPERQHPTSVAMPDGSIILMGGYNTGAMNDVRRSDDGGWTWMQLPNAGWSARSSHSSVAMPDGSIVIMGGFGGAQTNTARNDTWRLQPAGSNEQNPSHTYNTPGTYAVTLQAYNDDGYNATRQIGYITVTAQVAPTAAFTANRTTGAAPLAVQFTDTSAGGPTSWTWDFGDGETSTEQSPAHTYATAGTYTVSLNATNAAGSNTHTEAGYITVSAAPVLPVANFSADPTSGTAPLTVTFTDTSTGSPTGWAWFFGDEASGGAWTQVTDGAGWSARYSHTGVAMSDGSIVIMGGIDGSNNRLNDTWRSIDGGASWTRMNASSGWTERLSHAAVARPDGSIILMGGSDASTRLNDTWRSIDGGGNWTCMNASSGWEGRADLATVAMPDGSIILTGGDAGNNSVDIFYNDTWRSIDGGGNWTCMNASSGWTERFGHTSVAMPDGSIILMGGVTNNPTRMVNDTWRLAAGETTWELMNASSGWTARYYHTSAAMPDGSVILMGGQDDSRVDTNTPQNDTWRSTDNGATWTQVNASAGWAARQDHTSVAMPDGSIILMGGEDDNYNRLNDVWRLRPAAGSSLQNPSHTYTAPGTYTVTLQASNAGGYDSTRRTDYITVSAAPVPPVANFIVNQTSGTAPLAIQFNDTSAGSPIVWNWSFGDGAWHNTTDAAERNVTHTYTAAGTYTVSLTVDNAAGSDTCPRAGYITVSAAPVLPTAAFSGTPTSGAAPLAVQFTDTSAGGPTSWTWDFGDGATSTEQSPAHTYSVAGTYTVNLTVSNAAGNDTLSRSGYITVTDPTPTVTPTTRPVYSGGGSTGGPGGYNVGGDSAVSKVNVTGTGLNRLIVTGWKQPSPGSGIPPAPGTPYQYVDLMPARFEEIVEATITFTVPVSWLDEHGFTLEEVVMYHYNGTAWEALPTWVVDDSGTTVTFTATTPGFSLFAISGVGETGEATTTPTATTPPATAEPTATQTTAAPAGEPAPGFPSGTIAIVVGAVLVLAVGGYLIRRWWISG